jgi:hypothetical protein
MTFIPVSPGKTWSLVAALACVTASSGCTSVISSAYLREAWLDAVEHAAEVRAEAKQTGKASAADAGDADAADETVGSSADGDAAAAPEAVWSPATLDEAVDEAKRRLADSGGLNAAARGTLIATLKGTPRQDWPVVVEEFSAALAAAHVDSGAGLAAAAQAMDEPPRTPAETGATADTNREAAADGAEPLAPMPPAETQRAAAPAPDQQVAPPSPVEPAFAVKNACFASRVRAWGVVDRFDTSQFQPGQELIVYFELDELASRQSAEGHTTRIDTVLKLIDADGRRVHDWTFEPLEETCGSHRRDYFARYLVALPATMPAGPCRLEVLVTDTIAGRTAQASLPLEVTR